MYFNDDSNSHLIRFVDGKEHCWHSLPKENGYRTTREVCCHCGAKRDSWLNYHHVETPGHGEYIPVEETVRVHPQYKMFSGPEECIERKIERRAKPV